MTEPQPLTTQVLRYYGGKGGKLARWIIDHMPAHEAYIEPFCGGASVFFMKPPSSVEVINDSNGEVINFFRVCREQPDELARLLSLTPWARAEHALAWEPCDKCSDVEKARRLAVKAWQGFGHKVVKNPGWDRAFKAGGGMVSIGWQTAPDAVLAAGQRLREANIENKDAIELIRLYSKPQQTALFTRLFYVDPPYMRDTLLSSHGYGAHDVDHEALLQTLLQTPYYVLLSGYHNALYDEMLQDWRRVEVDKVDHVQNRATECLWINPPAWEALQREKGKAQQRTLFD